MHFWEYGTKSMMKAECGTAGLYKSLSHSCYNSFLPFLSNCSNFWQSNETVWTWYKSNKTTIKNTIANFSLKHRSPFNGLCLGWRSIWNLQVSNKLPLESVLNPPVQIKLSSSSLAVIYEESRIQGIFYEIQSSGF